MRGLELSEGYFREYGLPMLEEQFPGLLPYLAAGLCGEGSECLGFDDNISEDHDFEPGFCLFLPGEEVVDRKAAFALEKAYLKLPKEYRGYRRSLLAPAGGARHGMMRISEFFEKKCGRNYDHPTISDWFSLPEQGLLEATNGKIFFDRYGEVTKIRAALSAMPEDVRKKKISGQLLLAAQSGQYNFPRILAHGEPEAAALALAEFTESAIRAAHLISGRYTPYYKWSFRSLRERTDFPDLAPILGSLLSFQNDPENAARKIALVEQTASRLSEALRERALSSLPTDELELQAYEVNKKIADPAIRNLHILYAV